MNGGPPVIPSYDVIVLAGGDGSRLGGADKPAIVLGGHTLLDRALAATTDARARVVVGPPRDLPAAVRQAREDPPGSGPAAATATGLAALAGMPTPDLEPAEWTLILAGDLADAAPGVRLLLDEAARLTDSALPRAGVEPASRRADVGPTLRDPASDPSPAPDGVCLRHEDGALQWLFGIYRTAALTAAVAAFGDPSNRSMRRLLAPLNLLGLDAGSANVHDIDTPDDLRLARGCDVSSG